MNQQMIQELIAKHPGEHYVYLLKDPDGRPFYVGLGQGLRIFQHEEDARGTSDDSQKARRIREILASGNELQYEIDSFHASTPWNREEQLIRRLEREHELTNAQRYAPASEKDGVVLRKYADAYTDGRPVTAIPEDFTYKSVKLAAGPRRPGPRAKVYGRIYQLLERHPGITGARLIEKLHDVDWSDVRSAYAEGRSQVSGKWLADYIKGASIKRISSSSYSRVDLRLGSKSSSARSRCQIETSGDKLSQ